MTRMYRCSHCTLTLSEDKFNKNRTRFNGLATYCRLCSQARTESRRAKNPEAYLLERALYRAKEKSIECTITMEDIVIPESCPVFGFKLEVNGDKWSSPSIDRIDNSKGYIPGNIRIISYRANILRHTGTLEEFEKLVEYLRK